MPKLLLVEEHDGEDTGRPYALAHPEAGVARGSPKTVIGDGTDWRFLPGLPKDRKG